MPKTSTTPPNQMANLTLIAHNMPEAPTGLSSQIPTLTLTTPENNTYVITTESGKKQPLKGNQKRIQYDIHRHRHQNHAIDNPKHISKQHLWAPTSVYSHGARSSTNPQFAAKARICTCNPFHRARPISHQGRTKGKSVPYDTKKWKDPKFWNWLLLYSTGEPNTAPDPDYERWVAHYAESTIAASWPAQAILPNSSSQTSGQSHWQNQSCSDFPTILQNLLRKRRILVVAC
ncbi:hypothetical protein BJ508DRAFT_302358 [Ascobolus immersus RN42]|uniref:Uncharacterized protein n=1 Tax=Ascobolus immersus RN42 TaxID=1160509 RepID=A0A3N4IJH2_ASCIM|nr:hypothetical protein BJ508DRAFT_302358 [Ascobolus immersus RN42]